jgi:hypothetical protein
VLASTSKRLIPLRRFGLGSVRDHDEQVAELSDRDEGLDLFRT